MKNPLNTIANAAAALRWHLSKKSANPFASTAGISAPTKQGTPLTSPYEQSTWVFAGINLIASEIYALPLLHKKGDVDFSSPELEAFWRAPADGLAYSDLIVATVASLALDGICFWMLDDTWFLSGKKSKKNPLIFASARQVRAAKSGGEIVSYTLAGTDGRTARFLPSQVIKISNWSPTNKDDGTPNIKPARLAAHADLLAREYYLNTMQKAATRTAPSIISKGAVLDAAQRESLEASIRQSEYLDRPVFYSAEVDIKYPLPSVPGAEFTANRLGNREEIAIALGIPPSMFQLAASYSVGSASDRYRLIENTCIPRSIKIAEAMSRVSQAFERNPDITTAPDWDNHPVISETRRERLATAISLYNTGMPWSEINSYLDLGMKPFAHWQSPFNTPEDATPAADGEADPPAPLQKAAPGDAILHLEKLIKSHPATPEAAGENPSSPAKSTPSPAHTAAWHRQQLAQNASRKATFSCVRRLLMSARSQTLKNLENAPLEKARENKAGAAGEITFDLSTWAVTFDTAIRARQQATLKQAARDMFTELRQNPVPGVARPLTEDDPLIDADPAAREALRTRQNLMRDVPGEVHSRVKDEIAASLDAGESRDKIAARIRAVFNDEIAHRATVIAQTETNAIYGLGNLAAMKHAGCQYKKWLAGPDLPDAPVRPSHRSADEAPAVPVDEPFLLNGHLLQHPGDASAPPSETVNCRCCVVPVAAP